MAEPSFTIASGDAIDYPVLAPVSRSYPSLTGRLPTCYSPVRRSIHNHHPEGIRKFHALDLHVLGTPPAFVLSQDQTLKIVVVKLPLVHLKVLFWTGVHLSFV